MGFNLHRGTYEYEKKLYNDHLESLQVMEKNYMAMSREVEKLRAQLSNSTNYDNQTGIGISSYFISLVYLSYYLESNVLKMQMQERSMVGPLYIVEMFLWGTILLARPMVCRYIYISATYRPLIVSICNISVVCASQLGTSPV